MRMILIILCLVIVLPPECQSGMPCGKNAPCGIGQVSNGDIDAASTAILIESEGGAAEWQGSRLGYFDLMDREENSRPVYSQRAGTEFLYHHKGRGSWVVGSTVGGYDIGLKLTSANLTPPSNGWQHWDGSNWKTDDNTLRLTTSPPDPASTCTNIKVSSTGPAATAQRDKMGIYRWEGEWLSGRKLYVGGVGNKMYLRVATGSAAWTIHSSKDSNSSGISSGRATTCPCRGAGPSSKRGVESWRYADDGMWHEDSRLQVTCV